jgi:hypothetical protein
MFIFVTKLIINLIFLYMFKNKIMTLFLYISINFGYSQSNGTFKEIGVMAGPVFFQSDYGERGDFENYIKQNGFSIGVFYYLTPNINSKNIGENLKFRLEASYMKSQLQHYGKWVDPNKTSDLANQLRAMRGSVSTKNLGFQVEYYPFKTDDYCRFCVLLNPYASLGTQLSGYTSEFNLGPLGVPDKFRNSRNASAITGSFTAGFGVRYKFANEMSALIFDYRLQYYYTDWIDGVNPDKRKYSENKSNDYSTTFNFGYVYYFQ